MNIPTDEELASRLRNGDISAGGVLYERYKRNVYYFVVKMIRHDEAAQDIVQQTFAVMIEKISSLQQNSTLRQWLFSIARNESLMYLRRKKIVPMDGLDGTDETDESIFETETPYTLYVSKESSEIVHEAVHDLTPAYKEIILLRLTEQLSYEEIAEITSSTVGAVRSKLHKARTALAKKLLPYIEKE